MNVYSSIFISVFIVANLGAAASREDAIESLFREFLQEIPRQEDKKDSAKISHYLVENASEDIKNIKNMMKAARKKKMLPIITLIGSSENDREALATAMAQELEASSIFIECTHLSGRYSTYARKALEYRIKNAKKLNPEFMVVILNNLDKFTNRNDSAMEKLSYSLDFLIDCAKSKRNVLFISTGDTFNNVLPQLASRMAGKIIKLHLPTQEQKKQALSFYLADRIDRGEISSVDIVDLEARCKKCGYTDLFELAHEFTKK